MYVLFIFNEETLESLYSFEPNHFITKETRFFNRTKELKKTKLLKKVLRKRMTEAEYIEQLKADPLFNEDFADDKIENEND